MWTLEQGTTLTSHLQPAARRFNYHVAIGGGVVNNGFSNKDLDLYFLPMGGFDDRKRDPEGLIAHLQEIWGRSENIGKEYYKNEGMTYEYAVKFMRNGNERIDCFIF